MVPIVNEYILEQLLLRVPDFARSLDGRFSVEPHS
jgi:hypothetical protein